MKIAKFTLLLLFLIPNNSFAQLRMVKITDPVYLETEKKIRIKNKIMESFEYIYQNKSHDSILKSHTTFNNDGETYTYVVFNKEQDTLNYVTYDYEGEKLVISKLFNREKGFLVLTDNSTFSYDKKGNNTEIKSTKSNGNTVYQKLDYNSQNLKKTLYTKWLDNTDFSITEEYFYSNNHLIQKKTYNRIGKLAFETKYKYDNLGNLVATYQLQNGNKHVFHSYSYYKNTNQMKSESLYFNNPKSRSIKTKFEYDSLGNRIKKHFVNGNLKSTHTFTYKKFE